jgi:hypothetical protein
LIHRFADLSEQDRTVLVEAHRSISHHAAPALKAALLAGDPEFCKNACEIVLLSHDFDQFANLLKAAENARHPHSSQITSTLFKLAALLHDELAGWGAEADHTGRDPAFARHHVLAALERSIASQPQVQRPEILDAFLMLAPVDNPMLLQILRDPTHPCHAQIISTLATSEQPTIMERLVALLRDSEAPPAVLDAIARRTDPAFVNFLLRQLRLPVPLRVLHNMKRLRSVAWLEAQRHMLLELDGRAQATAVALAMASDIPRDATLELLALVLRNGLADGRRTSCQALAKFDGREADDLVHVALNDPDGAVQAAAVRQLRPRRLPNALQMLVARLESNSIEVRDAARSSLAEFNFVRYRAMFDLLDEHAVRSTGALVRQVDGSAREKLASDLMSPSVTTRLRAIEMAVAMESTQDVRPQLIELARHENVALRTEAIAALAQATGPDVVAVLELAAKDANRSVADAARQSLARHAVGTLPPSEDASGVGQIV